VIGGREGGIESYVSIIYWSIVFWFLMKFLRHMYSLSLSLSYSNSHTGQNLFVGAGVMVMVGYQDTSTFLALSRAGFGQYTGR